jgi:anti-sigma factor RsiW
MRCANWEDQVALLAGGDLETAEAATVERHLSECAACSALAADLRAGLDGLRDVHTEPLAEAHYAAVRARVLAELAKAPGRRAVWPWAWAAALAAAAAGVWVVSLVLSPSTLPAPQLPRVVATAPMVERPVLRQPGSNRSADNHAAEAGKKSRDDSRLSRLDSRRHGVGVVPSGRPVEEAVLSGADVQAVAQASPPAPPAATNDSQVRMVQLVTDDPNVVIYWLFENTGEGR